MIRAPEAVPLLCLGTEAMIALAFGVLNNPDPPPIKISKNWRKRNVKFKQ